MKFGAATGGILFNFSANASLQLPEFPGLPVEIQLGALMHFLWLFGGTSMLILILGNISTLHWIPQVPPDILLHLKKKIVSASSVIPILYILCVFYILY